MNPAAAVSPGGAAAAGVDACDWRDGRAAAQACYGLLAVDDWRALAATAAALRDVGWGAQVSYSRKVFVPLTQLCRDVCHYCTFARTPRRLDQPYLSVDAVLDIARRGAQQGCKEALFTLGDKPELRYAQARDALHAMGYPSTLAYLDAVARRVVEETGLLPHLNPGLMDAADFAGLRKVAPSMGIMLESTAERLCEKGGAHHGSPDKAPAERLETMRLAGEAKVPLTTGILIGIGETRRERIEALLAIRDLHDRHGHIQEIIVQNFRAKPGTRMAKAPEPAMDELCWTVAVARLIFGSQMSIQAPPNLYSGDLGELIRAGINDWGGVSPVTPDHVNPEAPWPHLDALAEATARAGHRLVERLTVYPRYIERRDEWIDAGLHRHVLRLSDGAWRARVGDWCPGSSAPPSMDDLREVAQAAPESSSLHTASPVAAKPLALQASPRVADALARAQTGEGLTEYDLVALFDAHGPDFAAVCEAADRLRAQVNGERVTYVVTRNINYTNVCLHRCGFCAFSKGKAHEALRGQPYLVELDEIQRRVREAWERGATEVCMQGGIHPSFTGETYLAILRAAKEAVPQMHVHAFSPLEVTHGAKTLGLSIADFLRELRAAGLGSLPGTAAEILDDDIRRVICPDKLDTQAWLGVLRDAHEIGLRTTSTIMFGHVEGYVHWARHLLHLRDLQRATGGITELVPLPFVHMEAPMYLKGLARKGPTLREAILMHAVARLALHPLVPNIQVSWVKLGPQWAQRALQAGANDMGGTLMNESISRAAGAAHGQEMSPREMEALIRAIGREPVQRTTLYAPASAERRERAWDAPELTQVVANGDALRQLKVPGNHNPSSHEEGSARRAGGGLSAIAP